MLLRSKKSEIVSHLEKICAEHSGIFITHYHGMTVSDINALKKALKPSEVKFQVVKNSLLKIAAANAGKKLISSVASGPVAIAYSHDAVTAAKLLDKFASSNQNFKIIGGMMDSDLLSQKEVANIAKLPSLNEIRSMLVAAINAPASKLVRLLSLPSQNVINVLDAHSKG